MNADPADMTLDELRLPLARCLRNHVPFDGWTPAALDCAASDLGIPASRARLVFPGGAAEMVDAHTALSDVEMLDALDALDIRSRRMRERITLAIRTRLQLAEPHRETVRRGLTVLAMPQNLGLAARTLWRTADAMWRAAGDTATDYNHYTKRLTLGAVYSASLLAWLADESGDREGIEAFIDRRIDDIMRFEKLKGRFTNAGQEQFSLARFLGRLRYPAPRA